MAKQNMPTRFTVEGTYPFPADMLRYDACYPATTDDAVQMAESFRLPRRATPPPSDNAEPRKRKVTLNTWAQNRPTTGRWESFGWKVIS